MSVFCVECGKFVDYTVKGETVCEVSEKDGVQFSYVKRCAYCKECGFPVFNGSIHRENIEAEKRAYLIARENAKYRFPGDTDKKAMYELEKQIDGKWYYHGTFDSVDKMARAANSLGEYGIKVRVKEVEE